MMNPFNKKNIKKLNSGFTRLNILLYLPLLLILTFQINKTFSETNDEIDLEYLDKKNSIDFNTVERLAIKNRYLGWLPKYRKDLRMKYKNNSVNTKLHYTFLSFLRSYKRLIFN